MFTSIKLKIQNFGRFLSNMIMPNISIFIALGILTVFFIPLGWRPNESLEHLISPVIFYLLPLFISYTGGRLISGERGGLTGSIGTIGVIVSSDTPMLLGAMIIGPLSGCIISYFDKKIENKIKNGFEMLVNNFSVAIIGVLLSVISFFIIGPLIEFFLYYLSYLVKILIQYNLLPLTSIIIEPAKIFFLNNAINHGVFSALGIRDISENHSSLFFLMESNPGPGLGVLIAWFFFGKGELRKSSGSAVIIEFLGGIHEIYFPYVLIHPKLIISLILGGMVGVFFLIFLHGGLISIASPGSIISILAMTPKNLLLANMLSIFFSFLISFLSSALILKFSFKNNKQNKHTNQENTLKNFNNINTIYLNNIKTIVVACDAGMGSSAMGASILRKKIQHANLMHISVSNTAINAIPKNSDLIITHKNLTNRAKEHAPFAKHLSLKNFLNHEFYDKLVENLIKNVITTNNNITNHINILDSKEMLSQSDNIFELSEENIFLNQKANNKEEAIKTVGKYLVKQGYVHLNYINSMLDREKLSSTWLGESVALPHGTVESKDSVLKTGIIFCQFPEGVHFGEEIDDIAYIVIGIAAKNNEHLMVVSNITNALDKKDTIDKLSKTNNAQEVLELLTVKNLIKN